MTRWESIHAEHVAAEVEGFSVPGGEAMCAAIVAAIGGSEDPNRNRALDVLQTALMRREPSVLQIGGEP